MYPKAHKIPSAAIRYLSAECKAERLTGLLQAPNSKEIQEGLQGDDRRGALEAQERVCISLRTWVWNTVHSLNRWMLMQEVRRAGRQGRRYHEGCKMIKQIKPLPSGLYSLVNKKG